MNDSLLLVPLQLKEWNKFLSEWVMKMKKRPKFLIINSVGELVKMPNYADMLRTLCKRHELMLVTLHMFRHTHETVLWESGVADINYIRARLGGTNKDGFFNILGQKANTLNRNT